MMRGARDREKRRVARTLLLAFCFLSLLFAETMGIDKNNIRDKHTTQKQLYDEERGRDG